VAQRLTCRRDEMIEEEKRRRDLLFTYRNFDESDEEFAARLERRTKRTKRHDK
jgi:hypothetical protein